MTAAARIASPAASDSLARDLLDDIATATRALRDLATPGETFDGVSRSDLSALHGFLRRVPVQFPELAAHVPEARNLLEDLATPAHDLHMVARRDLFSMLDLLAVAQARALDMLRGEDAAAPPQRVCRPELRIVVSAPDTCPAATPARAASPARDPLDEVAERFAARMQKFWAGAHPERAPNAAG